jgi:tetratricopeptide (TPR) repeat protein
MSVLAVVADLADLHYNQNDFQLAEQMYQRVLEWRATPLDSGHNLILRACGNLGRVCCVQGRIEDAEHYLSRALEGLGDF